METELNAIFGGSGSVTVTRNSPGESGDNVANVGKAGGYVWMVQFAHARVGGDVPMMQVEADNITWNYY